MAVDAETKGKPFLELVPGITDPASIAFRSESEILASTQEPEQLYIREIMPQKLRLNLEYKEHASMFNDFMIIVKTIAALFQG